MTGLRPSFYVRPRGLSTRFDTGPFILPQFEVPAHRDLNWRIAQ